MNNDFSIQAADLTSTTVTCTVGILVRSCASIFPLAG